MNPGCARATEDQLFLLLSRPFLSQKLKENIIGTSNHAPIFFNSKRFIHITQENGVSGLIYTNITKENLFLSRLKKELHQYYNQTAYKNMQLLRDTLEILKVLYAHGISVIPLKGTVASDLIFNDLGVYPSGDIDILVHPDQLTRAKKIICEECRYTETAGIDEDDLLATHYHLNLSNGINLLEVHWNLVKRYYEIPADFWWRETKTTTWNNIELIELSPEKYILYLVFRLFDHCFYPLRFFVIIAGLIGKNESIIDWDKLIVYAKQYKMKKLLFFSLRLLHEMLNTNIPEHIIKTKFIGYKCLKNFVFSGIFSGIKRKHARMMIYTLLIDDPAKIIKVLTGRIFPSKSEVRLRYNIPPNSAKVYLYLILNPFLLFVYRKSY